MTRSSAVVIAIALLVYAVICGTLYAVQRSLLYFPTPESHSVLAEAVRIETSGAVLKVWHIASSGERAILYFGGNAEDVGWNIEAFAAAFPNTDVYLVNYRGYGGSSGAPSEAALLADAETVFDEVRRRHPRVAVIGRSLGSGVAVHLAAGRDVSKLALVTPYDSIARVAQRHYAFVPVAWLLRDTFDSFRKARNVRAPVLVLLAEHDRVIPRAHSERLVTAFAPGQAEVRTLAGTNHDSIASSQDYQAALAAFLLY
jgi:pimeloyl-ACP methyl ester carboxylesterase